MVHPTERFTGLAEVYAQARPTYPQDAIDYIERTAQLGSGSLIADVGCGTGISTRIFAGLGYQVIGIEPNEDMRRQAVSHRDVTAASAANSANTTCAVNESAADSLGASQLPHIQYLDGTAEETGLADASVDLVLSAQAFHWFDPQKALDEFRRITKLGGWVALVWNERDESDAFTCGFGDAMRTSPETAKVEGHRGKAGEPLLTCKQFGSARKVKFGNSQKMDESGVLGRAFSASYAPKDEPGMSSLRQSLKELFARFQNNGSVNFMYETTVYMAQRVD